MDMNRVFAYLYQPLDSYCTGTVLHKLIDNSTRSDLLVRLILEMCYNVIISIVQVSRFWLGWKLSEQLKRERSKVKSSS
jgi:hypothetical protein